MLADYVQRMGWQTSVKDMPLRVANSVLGGVKRKQEMMVYNYQIEQKLF